VGGILVCCISDILRTFPTRQTESATWDDGPAMGDKPKKVFAINTSGHGIFGVQKKKMYQNEKFLFAR